MIPGSNLLNQAFSLIAKQTVEWYKFDTRVLNDIGLYEDVYFPEITIQGSLQPIHKNLFEKFGLNLAEDYANFYVSTNLIGLGRDYSGDYLIFNNDRYVVQDNAEWFPIDGWTGLLMIKSPLNNQTT